MPAWLRRSRNAGPGGLSITLWAGSIIAALKGDERRVLPGAVHAANRPSGTQERMTGPKRSRRYATLVFLKFFFIPWWQSTSSASLHAQSLTSVSDPAAHWEMVARAPDGVSRMVVDRQKGLLYVWNKDEPGILCLDQSGAIQTQFPHTVSLMTLLPDGNLLAAEPAPTDEAKASRLRHRLIEIFVQSGEKKTLYESDQPLLAISAVDSGTFLLVTPEAVLSYSTDQGGSGRTVLSLPSRELAGPSALALSGQEALWVYHQERKQFVYIDLRRPDVWLPPTPGSFETVSRIATIGRENLLVVSDADTSWHLVHRARGATFVNAPVPGREVLDIQYDGLFLYVLRRSGDQRTIYRSLVALCDPSYPASSVDRSDADRQVEGWRKGALYASDPHYFREDPGRDAKAIAEDRVWALQGGYLHFFSFGTEKWTRRATTANLVASLQSIAVHREGVVGADVNPELFFFDTQSAAWRRPALTRSYGDETEVAGPTGDDWLVTSLRGTFRVAGNGLTQLHGERSTSLAVGDGAYVFLSGARAFLGEVASPGVRHLERVRGDLYDVEYDPRTGRFWISANGGLYEVSAGSGDISFHSIQSREPVTEVLITDGTLAYRQGNSLQVTGTRDFAPTEVTPTSSPCGSEGIRRLLRFEDQWVWYLTDENRLCGTRITDGALISTKVPSVAAQSGLETDSSSLSWVGIEPVGRATRSLSQSAKDYLLLPFNRATLYHVRKNRFFVFPNDPFPVPTQLVHWQNGIYAATSSGLFEITQEGLIPSRSITGDLGDEEIRLIVKDQDCLWVHSERGLFRVDSLGRSKLQVPSEEYESPSTVNPARIQGMARNGNTLWLLVNGQLWGHTLGQRERLPVVLPFAGDPVKLVQAGPWIAVELSSAEAGTDVATSTVFLYDTTQRKWWRARASDSNPNLRLDEVPQETGPTRGRRQVSLVASSEGMWLRHESADVTGTFRLARLTETNGRLEPMGQSRCAVARIEVGRNIRFEYCPDGWRVHERGRETPLEPMLGHGSYRVSRWGKSAHVVGNEIRSVLVRRNGEQYVVTDRSVNKRVGRGAWHYWLPTYDELPWTVAVQPERRFSIHGEGRVASVTLTDTEDHASRRTFLSDGNGGKRFALSRERVLFATDGQIVQRLDLGRGRQAQLRLDSPAMALLSDQANALWIVTKKDLRLFGPRLEPKRRIALPFELDSTVELGKRPFFEDDKRLWLGLGRVSQKGWLVYDWRTLSFSLRDRPPLDGVDVVTALMERRCEPDPVIGHDRDYWWGFYDTGRARIPQKVSLAFMEAGCRGIIESAALKEGKRSTPPWSPPSPSVLQRACDAGDTKACVTLASTYENGWKVVTDYGKARGFYQKACDLGDVHGCLAVAHMFEVGQGGPVDPLRAAQQYEWTCAMSGRASASQMSLAALACYNLALYYRDGKDVSRDEARAVRLYEQACESGYALACYVLGDIHARGAGVVQDVPRARELFRKGCCGGISQACEGLKKLK